MTTASPPSAAADPAQGAEPDPAGVLDRLSSLADETRVRLLLLLETSELTVGELGQVLQMPVSTISRHLGILSQEGWLRVRSEGTSRHYRFSSELSSGAEDLWSAVRDDLSRTGAAREDRIRAKSVLQARAERSKAFFTSEAGRWDHLKGELFGERADLQLLAGLLAGSEVVGDLGCGTAGLTGLLAPFAAKVIGVDRSPEMLTLARDRMAEHPNVELRQGELESLPIEDHALDVAVLSLVLHYVVEPRRVLGEVGRVLAPDGRILILDMQGHDRAGFREEMGHLWLGFARKEMEGWLGDAGFEDVRMVSLPPHPEATGPRLFALRARTPGVGGVRPPGGHP